MAVISGERGMRGREKEREEEKREEKYRR